MARAGKAMSPVKQSILAHPEATSKRIETRQDKRGQRAGSDAEGVCAGEQSSGHPPNHVFGADYSGRTRLDAPLRREVTQCTFQCSSYGEQSLLAEGRANELHADRQAFGRSPNGHHERGKTG